MPTENYHALTDQELMIISQRFKEFRKQHILIGQAELCKELGISQKTLSFYENGHRMPTQKTISYLSKKYKLDPEWLLSGKGEPVSDAKAEKSNVTNLNVRVASLEREVSDLKNILKQIVSKLEQA